jgi:dephospho-CoA kinase
MKRIGITGGIGSGKTTVSQYLMDKGYTVIDADKVARELVDKGSPALLELVRAFGGQILTKEGELDRKSLAAIAFTDPDQKRQLDQVMHPRILERIESLIKDMSGAEVVFVDAALIFEAGWDKCFDQIWLVDANEEIRIDRIRARDELTREQVLERMNAQLDSFERRQRADRVLWNEGSKEALREQVEGLLNELKGDQ